MSKASALSALPQFVAFHVRYHVGELNRCNEAIVANLCIKGPAWGDAEAVCQAARQNHCKACLAEFLRRAEAMGHDGPACIAEAADEFGLGQLALPSFAIVCQGGNR